MSDVRNLFRHTADYAAQFHETLDDRPVHAQATFDELVEALGGPLPDEGGEDVDVVSELIAAGEPGVVGTQTGRYFGFVIGSALPALGRRGLARDGVGPERLLGRRVAGGRRGGGGGGRVARRAARAAAMGSRSGFVTGAQVANTTALAAARQHVLRAGGLGRRAGRAARGAARSACSPAASVMSRSTVRCGCSASAPARVELVAADEQGRMRADALREVLLGARPARRSSAPRPAT